MVRILLVDDSRVTREVTKVYLIAKDVELLDARNGEDALSVVQETRPDVIIADMQMPKLDGVGLCMTLKQNPETAEIPVIILTSNLDPNARERCMKAGAREVLNKPVQPHALISAIKRELGSAAHVLPLPTEHHDSAHHP